MSATAQRAFLLCGPSLSGKSTAAEALRAALGAAVISADRIQAERGVPFGAEGLPESVWAETLEIALALLRQRARDSRHIVLDDTLCYRWLRDRIRQECRTAGLATALLLFRASPEEILRRHAALLRDGSRPVLSRERLLAHLRDFEWPAADEEAVDLAAEPALRAYLRGLVRGDENAS